jgi:uncharacterized membrane protein
VRDSGTTGDTVNAALTGLFATTFVACFVEAVEAATIVLALGFTRQWRSTAYGVAAALASLDVVIAIFRVAVVDIVPEAALQLVVGALLLLFGLQWLRKAILRSAGVKALHDEASIYAMQVEAAVAEEASARGFDGFAFVVSFKGVFLEGMEVVFIVLSFGISAGNVPLASIAAALAVCVVAVLAFMVRGPLASVDENLLKYGVGIMLTAFGTFWAVEGMGVFRAGQASVEWPGGDWSILVLIAAWLAASRLLIVGVRRLSSPSHRHHREVAA